MGFFDRFKKSKSKQADDPIKDQAIDPAQPAAEAEKAGLDPAPQPVPPIETEPEAKTDDLPPPDQSEETGQDDTALDDAPKASLEDAPSGDNTPDDDGATEPRKKKPQRKSHGSLGLKMGWGNPPIKSPQILKSLANQN